MATFTHCYLTGHGTYASGPFQGEIAQVGFRLAAWPAPTQPDVMADLPVREASEDFVNDSSDSVFTAQYAFQGETVLPGGTENYFGRAEQLALATSLWTRLLASSATWWNNTWRWTHIKIAPIGPDGKYATPSSVFTAKTPLAGSSTANMPAETSVAITMRTPVLGRRGRGRVFMPALAASTLANDGTVATTRASSFSNAVKGLLEDAAGVGVEATYRVVITSADSAQYVLPTAVRVGNMFDVQRRRQNRLREGWLSEQAVYS